MISLSTESYSEQRERWPGKGRHVLAQFDDHSVYVYQAYRPSIGRYAIEHGRLGGPDFSFSRMSWIKPNFLWMMYRSGWGTKPGQEITLALRIRRAFFEELLSAAVPSTFWPEAYAAEPQWKAALASSDVRLQWDPDHDPHGGRLPRRAIQLGLRRAALEKLARDALIRVVDVTDFVAEQRRHVLRNDLTSLVTPSERPYTPSEEAQLRIGLS